MGRIIKIENGIITVGMEDGSFQEISEDAVNYADPKIGDRLKIYRNGDQVIAAKEELHPDPGEKRGIAKWIVGAVILALAIALVWGAIELHEERMERKSAASYTLHSEDSDETDADDAQTSSDQKTEQTSAITADTKANAVLYNNHKVKIQFISAKTGRDEDGKEYRVALQVKNSRSERIELDEGRFYADKTRIDVDDEGADEIAAGATGTWVLTVDEEDLKERGVDNFRKLSGTVYVRKADHDHATAGKAIAALKLNVNSAVWK